MRQALSTREGRAALLVVVLLISAPIVYGWPGGLWWLLPLGLMGRAIDRRLARYHARLRLFEIDAIAAMRGGHMRITPAKAAMARHAYSLERQELLRLLQIAGESAHLVHNSRSAKTVASRRTNALWAAQAARKMRRVYKGPHVWERLDQLAAELSDER